MTTLRICEHLNPPGPAAGGYIRAFTGEGLRYDLICPECSKDHPRLRNVTKLEFIALEGNSYWVGIKGQPEIKHAPGSKRFRHRIMSIIGLNSLSLRAFAPLKKSWLALQHTGELLEIDFETRAMKLVAAIGTELDQKLHLSICSSPDDRLIAVYETRGLNGLVIEEGKGPVFTFKRDDYYSQASPFGVAWVDHDERALLIHATDWNRIDVSDPKSGELITRREPPVQRGRQPNPGHYLDYFHGALFVSPGGNWIASDGWAWHPSGVVTSWNLNRFLNENIWESEDGPTCRDLCLRDHFWGGPMCWIDDRILAVWGYGRDEQWLLPAVCLFDVEAGKQVRWFPGPPTSRKNPDIHDPTGPFHDGWMTYDSDLFVCSADHGVSVWNAKQGARLVEDGSFYPAAYQRGSREFITPLEDGSFQLSRLAEG